MQEQGYKKSRFAVVVDGIGQREGKELVAILQIMSRAFMITDEESWRSILQNPLADSALLHRLLKEGVLVADSIDEAAVYRCWRQEHVHKFTVMKSHTVMDRACNLGCLYCILDSEPKKMDAETALQVDRFWTGLVKKKKPRRVSDVYSGGEALLNLEVLLESAARRFFFCEGNGVDFGFKIITNGTLLSPDVITCMKRFGLDGIRVSIAGPSRIHNRLRPFKNGGPTHEVIMKNLESISGLTKIVLEIQYDAGCEDYLHIPELLDEIQRRGIAVETVRFTPILPKRGREEFRCGVGDPQKLLFLMREAEKRGFPQFDTPPFNGCQADYRSAMVFDTDGRLKSCPAVQSEEFSYGSAARGIDSVKHSQFLERDFSDRCMNECELLPMCNGGCRLNSLSAGGSFKEVDCQYAALRLISDEQIRWKAREALSAKDSSKAA